MADKLSDSNDIICNTCMQPKTRIRSGKFGKGNGRTPRWVNENGDLFNGLCCPDCHKKRIAVRQMNKRLMGE